MCGLGWQAQRPAGRGLAGEDTVDVQLQRRSVPGGDGVVPTVGLDRCRCPLVATPDVGHERQRRARQCEGEPSALLAGTEILLAGRRERVIEAEGAFEAELVLELRVLVAEADEIGVILAVELHGRSAGGRVRGCTRLADDRDRKVLCLVHRRNGGEIEIEDVCCWQGWVGRCVGDGARRKLETRIPDAVRSEARRRLQRSRMWCALRVDCMVDGRR